MNYLPRNRTKNSYAKPALFLSALFLLALIVFKIFDGVLIQAATPLWKGENSALTKLSFVSDFFSTRNSLIRENNALRSRIAAMEIEIASRFSSNLTEEDLANLLGRRRDTGGIMSTALAVPPQTPYDTLVIDAGSNEGVVLDTRVFMPEGPILGKVFEVNRSSSKVKLFTTPGEKTAAILERHGIPITLEGAGGGNFRIELARETEVEVGDRILSADAFSELLGVVGAINMEPTDSFKEVLAKSPLSIFSINYLLVRP